MKRIVPSLAASPSPASPPSRFSRSTPLKALGTALLLSSFATLSAPAHAEVCYSAQGRGLSVSRYKIDGLGTSWLSAPMDFRADPWEVSGSSFLDFSNPQVFAAYMGRYGPFTACLGSLTSATECQGHLFTRFAGPSNEVRYLLADALAWWATVDPGGLGGGGCRGDGVASDREITDVQATSDNAIWERYHAQALQGGSAANPLNVCRTNRAAGLFTEVDSFWGWTNYLLNTCGTTPTPTDPTPADPTPVDPTPSRGCTAPPQSVLDAARRVRNRSSAKQAGQIVIDWLTAAQRCATGG